VTVLCQWCGTANPDGRELCLKCNSRLLVVSGLDADGAREALLEDESELDQDKEAFDEHLLERLSASEDAFKRLQSSLASLDDRVADLERSASLLDAGVQALIELLDRRRIIRETDVIAAWERAATTELAREELLERLRARGDRLARPHPRPARPPRALRRPGSRCSPASRSGHRPARRGRQAAPTELAELLGSWRSTGQCRRPVVFRQVVRWDDHNVGTPLLGDLVDSGRGQAVQSSSAAALRQGSCRTALGAIRPVAAPRSARTCAGARARRSAGTSAR
jgi:hypothetical protein